MLTRISREVELPAGTAAGEADGPGFFFGRRGEVRATYRRCDPAATGGCLKCEASTRLLYNFRTRQI
jgi:hypothetical protein